MERLRKIKAHIICFYLNRKYGGWNYAVFNDEGFEILNTIYPKKVMYKGK